jgi:hypothetical protein
LPQAQLAFEEAHGLVVNRAAPDFLRSPMTVCVVHGSEIITYFLARFFESDYHQQVLFVILL